MENNIGALKKELQEKRNKLAELLEEKNSLLNSIKNADNDIDREKLESMCKLSEYKFKKLQEEVNDLLEKVLKFVD